MNRVGDPLHRARHGLAITVGKESGHVTLVQERDCIDVQPGLPVTGVPVLPRAELEPAAMVTRAKDEQIALTETHPLCLLGSLELGAGHRRSGLQPGDAAEARYVE